jgi:colanic acid biosynthesis protein WcaH
MEAKLSKIISELESLIEDPAKGLPEEVFLFITSITPMVNVDLLIKNEKKQTLLTWRNDDHHPPGWHIPGGVIRYKEKAPDRIEAVAMNELGARIKFKEEPVAINEIILDELKERAHFISFLYECSLVSTLDENLEYKGGAPKNGEWAWHDKCPDNLIEVHNIYREYINN